MQLTAKSADSSAPATTSSAGSTAGSVKDRPSESEYVGKHRPGRMSLWRQRTRVAKLASREASDAQSPASAEAQSAS